MTHAMLRPAFAIAYAAIALPSLEACSPAPVEAGQRNSLRIVGSDTHDFGDVIEGDICEASFDLEVTGSAARIAAIKPQCGCTDANLFVLKPDSSLELYAFNEALQPGMRLRLQAKLYTVGSQDAFHTSAHLLDATGAPALSVHLQAFIHPLFTISPPIADFGRTLIGRRAATAVEVSSPKFLRFRLIADEAMPSDDLAMELSPVGPDENGMSAEWRLALSLFPSGSPNAHLHYPITLLVDRVMMEESTTLTLETPYQVHVVAEAHTSDIVFAHPDYLSFGKVSAGASVMRSFVVQSYGGEVPLALHKDDFGIGFSSSMQALSGTFDLSVQSLPDQAAVELRIEDFPPSWKGPFRGDVRVSLARQGLPDLTVPFFGFASE